MSPSSPAAKRLAPRRSFGQLHLSRLTLVLSVVLGYASSVQAQGGPLSLSDALKTAAFEHPSVAARIKERGAAEARLDVANRQKLPALVGQSGVDGLGNRTATFRIEQALWTGGRIDGEISSAQAGIRRADHVVAAAQNDIMLKVLNAFTELARVQARQQAARSNVDEHLRLAQMIDAGLVKSAADIFRIKPDDLLGLDRMGTKLVENLVSGIDASRTVTLSRCIYALGIRHIGERAAEILANHFGTLSALRCASTDALVKVHLALTDGGEGARGAA